MKKFTALLLLIGSLSAKAQNPISYPKDTLISKPELSFEVLWHTFEDNYAFLKLRNIDWRKTYDQYRPMIKPTTSDDSLYLIFTKMLAPFEDNHINVIIPGVKQFKSVKPSQFAAAFPTKELRADFWKMANKTLKTNGFSDIKSTGLQFKDQPLFYYAVSNGYGYLRFNRCFVDNDSESKPDAALAGKILDSVMLDFKNTRGLIVDVRDNIGGNDEFSFAISSRFSKSKSVGMYKETRIPAGGYDEFGAKETWYIEPTNNSYQKPVVVLTNDKTVSAGDVFAMIMKSLPQVSIIGTNSRGIYSDMYGFTLPNKWLISLSNQKYYSNKMVCYEGFGTPVDIKIENTPRDLVSDIDPVIIAALKELGKKTYK